MLTLNDALPKVWLDLVDVHAAQKPKALRICLP